MAEHLVRQSAQDEFGRTAPEPAGSGISATWLQPTFPASPRPYEVGRNEAEEDHKQARAGAWKRCSYRWSVPDRVLCLPIPPVLYSTRPVRAAGAAKSSP